MMILITLFNKKKQKQKQHFDLQAIEKHVACMCNIYIYVYNIYVWQK